MNLLADIYRSPEQVILRQMQVHRFGADLRPDQRSTNPVRGTNGAEDVGPFISLILGHARAVAVLRPNIGQAALLAETCFILPPKLDRLAASVVWNGGGDKRGKVFCRLLGGRILRGMT
ncbi:hypothetical protein [Rhodopila sp.]|uniref:hypothetical protein n=1 Tax=Rhodopila sp. TaxID=2480087 RepID=UPI003D0D2C1C